MKFSNILISWYLHNKRDLPWRKSKNPYNIWLSEIILQQTRIIQGLQYYKNFISSFPTIYDLAKADEGSILKLWQGLGYYTRARNLHFSAKFIVNELNGKFPETYNELLLLKGVGDYTASAIASICFNKPTAVVDGNVYRVLSRYFGINTPINSTKGIKEFKQLAENLINKNQPGTHNQAIMEFGALQCIPYKPDCSTCPLNSSCVALQQQIVVQLPVKQKKIVIKKRFFNYLVIIDKNNKVLLRQRTKKDIWQNLYEFQLIETSKEVQLEELIQLNQFSEVKYSQSTISRFNNSTIVHKLTHQHIYTKFWIINVRSEIEGGILWKDIHKYPVPILIHNFVKKFKESLKR